MAPGQYLDTVEGVIAEGEVLTIEKLLDSIEVEALLENVDWQTSEVRLMALRLSEAFCMRHLSAYPGPR